MGYTHGRLACIGCQSFHILTVVVNTSGHVCDDFTRLFFSYTHRETSILTGKLPQESELFPSICLRGLSCHQITTKKRQNTTKKHKTSAPVPPYDFVVDRINTLNGSPETRSSVTQVCPRADSKQFEPRGTSLGGPSFSHVE